MIYDSNISLISVLLALLLGIVSFAYYLLLRKYKLVRYLFIETSDWNSEKIDALVKCADELVRENVKRSTNESSTADFGQEVIESTPFTIRDAKKDWAEQKDRFQRVLIANNVAPLTMLDYKCVLLKFPTNYKLD